MLNKTQVKRVNKAINTARKRHKGFKQSERVNSCKIKIQFVRG